MRDLKLGHNQEAFPIFGSRKMCHHSGYLYINNQCSSLVDITYANYRCHEPERKDGSISEIFGLVCWMFTDANVFEALYKAYYTPAIYAKGYIVFVFLSLPSYVHSFVISSCSWNYFKILR